MGRTWFSSQGPSPVFTDNQVNGSRVTARLGAEALLACRVTALQDQLVSWFSIAVPDLSLTLLTVGFQTYSADSRFSLDFKHPNNYRLRISGVRHSDKGFYHCQLATHPPQLVWTYLDIVKPKFRKALSLSFIRSCRFITIRQIQLYTMLLTHNDKHR